MCVERSRRFWYLCLVTLCSSGLAYSRDLIHLNHETYPKFGQEDIIGQRGRGILSVPARKVLADDGAPDCGDNVSLDIIHMNDLHAHYTPATLSIGDCPEGSEDVCFGGMARIQTAVDTLLSEANNAGQDSLVLHAGDQFTGTIWDNIYTKENIQIAPQFLNQLNLAAFTLGNHEFDYTSQVLASFIGNLSMPVLACNVDFSNEPLLDGLTENYTIVELPRSGLKVGIVGLVDFYTNITSSPSPTITFLQPADVIADCVQEAKDAGADIVIGLTHIGYEEDMKLAALEEAGGLDIIIGGHTHTFLSNATEPPLVLVDPPTNETAKIEGPYPTFVMNPNGKNIPITQAFWAGRYLGNLNVTVSANGCGVTSLLPQSGPYLLGGKNSTNPVEPNATVAEELDALSGPIKAARNRIVGTTSVLLDGTRENVRNMETNLGGIIADSYTWYLGNTSSVGETYKGVPWVGMSFGGAIRASIDVGNITAEDCDSVLPFDDYVYVQLLNGTVLYAALNNGVSGWTGTEDASGRFPQISKELEFSFNPDPSVPQYSRVVNSNLRDPATGEYKPLESYDQVILITNEFAVTGGDNYTMLATAPVISQIPVADNLILCQYFGLVSPVNENTVETNRIVNCAIDSDDTLCSTTSPSEPVSEQSSAVTRRAISLTVFIVSIVFLFS